LPIIQLWLEIPPVEPARCRVEKRLPFRLSQYRCSRSIKRIFWIAD